MGGEGDRKNDCPRSAKASTAAANWKSIYVEWEGGGKSVGEGKRKAAEQNSNQLQRQ